MYEIGKPPIGMFGEEETKKDEKKTTGSDGEKKKNNNEEKKEEKNENKKKETIDNGEPFIEINHGPPPATPLFAAGDGFDLYIDAARFLPDNVTIPKVTARIFNHDFGYVAMSSSEKQETAVCNLTDNVFCPEWKLRMEYRRDDTTEGNVV